LCSPGSAPSPRRRPLPGQSATVVRHGQRGAQELVQVGVAVPPIATCVEADEGDDAPIAPRAQGIGMDAQDPGGLTDRERGGIVR
jgi:hypothetical protein